MAAGRTRRPKVLITRAQEDAGPLCRCVAQLGAEPVGVPAVAMEYHHDAAALETVLTQLPSFGAIAFASRYGVRALAHVLQARAATLLPAAALCAVGPSTAASVVRAFARVPTVVVPHTAQGLVVHLASVLPPYTRVLLPTAHGAGTELHQGLTQSGHRPLLLPLYRTVLQNAALDALTRAAAVDYIVFTSPSCVAAWVRWGRPSAQAQMLTLGPSTSRAVREAGGLVAAEAKPSSFAGLMALLKAVLCPHP